MPKIDASIKNAYIWQYFSLSVALLLIEAYRCETYKNRGSAKWKGKKRTWRCIFARTRQAINLIIYAPHEHFAKWAATKLPIAFPSVDFENSLGVFGWNKKFWILLFFCCGKLIIRINRFDFEWSQFSFIRFAIDCLQNE